ncbi:MAG TPA: class I SAM-dependent methyltransferase [Actinomycetota bacterium]|nr:class I SAM-dependent methyltransferase [Actinomycetota bacterium]
MSRFHIYVTWIRTAWRAVNWRLREKRLRPKDEAPAGPPGVWTTHDRWGTTAANQQEETPASLGWLDHNKFVRMFVWRRLFGDVAGDTWGEKASSSFSLPRGHWLSLGAGSGNIEIQMGLCGLYDSMLALEASPQAVDVANQTAKARGLSNLEFAIADLNTVRLPRGKFDVIHVNMALHHVSSLERLSFEINRALKPGGVFVANEFVGPNQFQFSDERLSLVKDALLMIPEDMRYDPVAKITKQEYPRYPRKHWRDWDPTESIRSDEIPRILEMNFPELKAHQYGGSILNLALENIVQHFDLDDPSHVELMQRLVKFESDLIDSGRIQSDFVYFVCPKGPQTALFRGWLAAKFDLRRRVTMSLRNRSLG